MGDNLPPFIGGVVRYTIDPDPYPNFTWGSPSMTVGESIPDRNGAHSLFNPSIAELYAPYFAASSSDFSLLSSRNPRFMSTSPPSFKFSLVSRLADPLQKDAPPISYATQCVPWVKVKAQFTPSLLAGR